MEPFIYNMDYVRQQSDKKLFNVISMFAGGGGSSTGYRLAGGNILAVNEFVPAAQETYIKNYPDTYIFKEDIRDLTGDYILNKLSLQKGELDILDGSPPCSSYSSVGKKQELWGMEKKYSDTKQRTDDLFPEFIRLINEIKPKVFVCENVKGLTQGVSSEILGSEQLNFFDNQEDTIYHSMVNCGYSVRYKVINSKDYGVAQSRERIIFIGVRNDIKKSITYPNPNNSICSIEDAFTGLNHTDEELMECDITKYKIYEVLKQIPVGVYANRILGGGSYMSLIKVDKTKPSPTFTQRGGDLSAAGICHWDNRKFTIKEALRICSFPDDYILTGTYNQKMERLGRAVPPLMMKAIAEHIYNTILKTDY